MSARGLQIGVLSYLDKDGQTLLIRKDSPGHYMHGYCVAPGGKRKENEALHDACIRETHEETGIVPLNPVLKGVISFPDNGDSPFGMEWLCFVFVFNEYSGEMLRKGPEGAVFTHRSSELA
ncbi:MAG: NUDIX domain-containing protein, partial [Candidatus Brocadiia bacterium]